MRVRASLFTSALVSLFVTAAAPALAAAADLRLPDAAASKNTEAARALIAGGADVNARQADGATALHVASWRGRPVAVRALIAGGADVNAKDAADRTPLMLAVKACVDSYWSDRRTPESVEALLAAGADPAPLTLPCGYEAVDALLSAR